MVEDAYSKYAFLEPLKSKMGSSVAQSSLKAVLFKSQLLTTISLIYLNKGQLTTGAGQLQFKVDGRRMNGTEFSLLSNSP